MVELTRRFFLGGAIALVAAQTFKPSISQGSNLPKIWGNGQHDDSMGLNALFNRDPVIFRHEDIGVESHEGIIIYKGYYRIDKPLEIFKKTNLSAPNGLRINASELPPDEPLIIYEETSFHPFNVDFKLEMKELRKVPLFKVMYANGTAVSPGNFIGKFTPPINGGGY